LLSVDDVPLHRLK